MGELLSWGEIFAPLISWGLQCCVIGDKSIKLLGNALTLPSKTENRNLELYANTEVCMIRLRKSCHCLSPCGNYVH